MREGDVLVLTKGVGGWNREFVPQGSQGTITSVDPLKARFVLGGHRAVEIPLYDGEWR